MARNTAGTVQQQTCLKEQIEKENAAMLRFFLKNVQDPTETSGASAVLRKKLDQARIDANRCARLAEEAAKRARERETSAKQKLHRSDITPEMLKEALDMRPASPKTKALLYEGISHDLRGRYQYLQKRYQKDPEEKFPFPMPTSWDYGWRLSDWIKRDAVKKSPYGHVSVVKNTFFTRTGVNFGNDREPKAWYDC